MKEQSTAGIETLSPTQATHFVARCIEAGLTPFLHGRPGVGKSAIVETVAKASGLQCQTLSLALMQPEDVRVPVPSPDGVRWAYSRALPRDGSGILFLDEFPQATESVQSVFGQLVYQGRLDDYALPPEWAVVCAGNRMEDQAAAHAIPTQIRNRMCHVTIETTVSDWLKYRPGDTDSLEPVRPASQKLSDAEPHPLFVALGQMKPQALATPDEWVDLIAWPTPRTLSMASGYIRHAEARRERLDETDWAIIAGLIGRPLATEIRAWDKLRGNIPTLRDVVSGIATPPEDPAARWVAALMLAEAAANEPKREHFDATMKFLAQCGVSHLAVAGSRMIMRYARAKFPGWIQWDGGKLYTKTLQEHGILQELAGA